MRPLRRRGDGEGPAEGVGCAVPVWVRRFEPEAWPVEPAVVDKGRDAGRTVTLPGRYRWEVARAAWCREHGVDLLGLIRAGEAEGRYAHLRPVKGLSGPGGP